MKAETMKAYGITQEMVEDTAQAYSAIVDRCMVGAQLDAEFDGGEYSGPAAERAMDKAIDQMFLEKANEYNVDVNALKEAVYEFLSPTEDEDYSGAPRIG
jgi:hypothetical protein